MTNGDSLVHFSSGQVRKCAEALSKTLQLHPSTRDEAGGGRGLGRRGHVSSRLEGVVTGEPVPDPRQERRRLVPDAREQVLEPGAHAREQPAEDLEEERGQKERRDEAYEAFGLRRS